MCLVIRIYSSGVISLFLLMESNQQSNLSEMMGWVGSEYLTDLYQNGRNSSLVDAEIVG